MPKRYCFHCGTELPEDYAPEATHCFKCRGWDKEPEPLPQAVEDSCTAYWDDDGDTHIISDKYLFESPVWISTCEKCGREYDNAFEHKCKKHQH